MQVAAQVADTSFATAPERLALLAADQDAEALDRRVAGLVAVVQEPKHRHEVELAGLLALLILVAGLHLDSHVADVRSDRGVQEAQGVLPRHVEDVEPLSSREVDHALVPPMAFVRSMAVR